MNDTLRAAIEDWQQQRNLHLPGQVQDRLQTLLDLWIRYGRSMNLTGSTSVDALVEHIRDGLDTALCARQAGAALGAGWLDIGSGGGFPGLVVLATQWYRVALIEPRQRRASFLELACRAVGSPHSGVFRTRFESSTWSQNGIGETYAGDRTPFYLTSARAVWEPARWLELGSHVVEPGGHVVIHLSEGASTAQFDPIAARVDGPHGAIIAKRVG